MAGLYFTRMSMFEPKPPLASTTALHAMVDSSPVTVFFTFTPVMASPLSTNSTAGEVLRQRQRVDLSGALRQLRGHLAAAVRDGDDGALRVVAAELHEVVLPRDAAFEGEPLRAVQRTFGDDLHEGGIACVVAAFQHVLRQRVGAVGDAFLHLDPVARRGHLAA